MTLPVRRFAHRRGQLLLLAGIAGAAVAFAEAAVADPGATAPPSSAQNPADISLSAAASDTAITSKIKLKLLGDQLMTGSSIDVSTSSGAVLLKGTVQAPEMIDEAAQVAQSVDGVKSVDNQIVMPKMASGATAKSSAVTAMTESSKADSEINRKIRDKLLTDGQMHYSEVGITTIAGVVRLFGQVQSVAQRQHAGLIASQVEGVKAVDTSALMIATGS